MWELTDSTRKFALYHALVVWRTKAFWLRVLLCWAIGSLVLMNDEVSDYDLRLKIRGPRPSPASVVIVDISERDWNSVEPETQNVLRPLKEVFNLSDAFFWNPISWELLLSRLLDAEPAAIGVTFFFGENIRMPFGSSTYGVTLLSPRARALFENPKVIWGADVDGTGRVLVPRFATTYNSNVGLRGVRADDDGTVRRFATSNVQVPHMAIRLAELANPALNGYVSEHYQRPALINFSGPAEAFRVVKFTDVVTGRAPRELFMGKVVVVGSLSSPMEQVQTPLGKMSRSEVVANIADNIVGKRTVERWPNWVYVTLLWVLMIGSLWILTSYPQSVALVFFVVAGILWAAASAWSFDVAHVWIPVLSPLAQLIVTYIVFLSYRLSLNEQKTWRLQQEQKYLSEIEQLKTNFVSMMSHDLKTPIAKIQAICDRLIATVPDGDVNNDLKSLRRSSDELHRYIQSILQVTKVEAKDFKISMEVMDINENVEKVVARLLPLAREKAIRIDTHLEPMFSIEADTTLVEECIHNLVENAIKYTPSGGHVKVTSEERDDNVFVVVEDSGPGIAPDEQKDIWGKFTRGSSTLMETKGTGLGLYLVKYFVELHGGRVFLESEPGDGTRIGFSLPIAAEAAPEGTGA